MRSWWWMGAVVTVMACSGTTDGTDDTDDTDVVDTDDTDPVSVILGLDGDATAGQTIYDRDCELCHMSDGAGNGPYPDIREAEDEKVVATVIEGPGLMPSAEDYAYENQDIADVLAYVQTL